MPKYLLLILLFTVPKLLLAETLTVAVAANVQYAFVDLAAAFQEKTGIKIRSAVNSSGKFAAQIMNGAPFDIFLSADMEYPEKLHQAGFTTDAPKIYIYGVLVLWTMKDRDLRDWQEWLSGSEVVKIAIPNPKTAPYGREILKALDHAKLTQTLTPKFIYGESVAQTNQYIVSQVVEVGLTAKSVVLAPEMRDQGRWIEIAQETYEPIAQGVVILKHGNINAPQTSRQFFEFLFSLPAQEIFQRYGYILP